MNVDFLRPVRNDTCNVQSEAGMDIVSAQEHAMRRGALAQQSCKGARGTVPEVKVRTFLWENWGDR